MDRDERLWAPRRLDYVSGKPAEQAAEKELRFLPGADAQCFICRAVADSDDRGNLVVGRSELSVVVLNRFPYNNGHLLFSPQLHKGRLDELSDHEQLDLQRAITRYVGLVEGLINAQGFNVGLNLGRAAGAGVPGHLHWHCVPRWQGDTNFMPTVAGLRVIPQSLDTLWELLHEAGGG